MPSDIEMTDCGSSSESGLFEIDPSITASVTQGAYSNTKKLITPERNKLAADIIEASECLKT
jgi:hypothetical protein